MKMILKLYCIFVCRSVACNRMQIPGGRNFAICVPRLRIASDMLYVINERNVIPLLEKKPSMVSHWLLDKLQSI